MRDPSTEFTGFPNDVGFNNGLLVPQPDFVEGLEMQTVSPVPNPQARQRGSSLQR
jgi:hypothetical protein